MNSFRLSVPEALVAALALVASVALTGCGPKDGSRERADGRAAFESGDFRRAEKLFLRAAERAPGDVDAPLYLARIKLQAGEIVAAREWLAKAEQLAAGDVDVRLLGAQIAWHANDRERALRLFSGVAGDETLPPRVRADALTGAGIVRISNDEHDLARLDFLRAIRLDRTNACARYHLGYLYRFPPFGYLETALDQFGAYIHLEKVATPRVQRLQRTVLPEMKQDIARRDALRPGAAKRDSAASVTALAKAEGEWKKGAYKSARLSYRAALEADPLSYPAALGLARAEQRLDTSVAGQKRAFEAYRQACTLRPSAISTFLVAGQLAEKLGLWAQAREIYSRALAANPVSLDAIDGLIRSIRKSGGNRAIALAYQDYRALVAKPKGR